MRESVTVGENFCRHLDVTEISQNTGLCKTPKLKHTDDTSDFLSCFRNKTFEHLNL